MSCKGADEIFKTHSLDGPFAARPLMKRAQTKSLTNICIYYIAIPRMHTRSKPRRVNVGATFCIGVDITLFSV